MGELAAQVGQLAVRQFLQTEVQLGGTGVAMQKGENVGETRDGRVGEMLLDHGGFGLEGVEDGPGAVVAGIAQAEGVGALEAGTGDAHAKVRQAVMGEGHVGEAGALEQRVALRKE